MSTPNLQGAVSLVQDPQVALSKSDAEYEAEWRAFWTLIADAATGALNGLSADHPSIDLAREAARHARAAADTRTAW